MSLYEQYTYGLVEYWYNVTYPVLLVVQIVLLVCAIKREKEYLFLCTLLLGGICSFFISFFEGCDTYMFGDLEKSLFIFFMPWLYGIVNLVCLVFRFRLRYIMDSRLPWRLITWASLLIGLYLDIHRFFLRV